MIPFIWVLVAVVATADSNPFTQPGFIKEASTKDVQAAIDAGWDINEPDVRNDETALITAIHFQRLDIARLLVEAGADLDHYPSTGTGLPDALRLAVVGEQDEAVRFLIEAGTDVDFRSQRTGTTSLMAAAARNLPGMARLLLEYGADPTLRSYKDGPDPELAGLSPRDFAVKYSGPAMVDLLDAALLVHAGEPRKGCMVATDRRFSDLAVRHFGDRERWREIWQRNDMKKGQAIRAGDCFLLPDK